MERVKVKCLSFYIDSVSQIFSRFPLKNSVFEQFQHIDSKNVLNKKISTIAIIAQYFLHLIDDIQVFDNEWRVLKNIDFTDVGISSDDEYDKDVIKF